MPDDNLINEIIKEVIRYFEGDLILAEEWFRTENPILTMSPLAMILSGRANKLHKAIINLKSGNIP